MTQAAAVIVVLAAAQEPVKAFDRLNTRLKPGDTVWVTDAQGREIKGKIRDLSPASLLIDAGGTPRDVQAARVRTIHMQASDPLGNGVLWGAVAGSVGGALSCAANPQCVGDDGGGAITAMLAAVGAAAGERDRRLVHVLTGRAWPAPPRTISARVQCRLRSSQRCARTLCV